MKTGRLLSSLLCAASLTVLGALMLGGCGTTASTTTTLAGAAGGPSGAAPVRFVVQLTGDEVVPPVNTQASGTFSLFVEGGPSPTGQVRISYELAVKDIADVTAAHIHLAAKGAEGEVVVPLFTGPAKTGNFTGVLAQGAILAADLSGSLAGKSLSDLLAAMQAGGTYVNVHTAANPNGEIRGQIVMTAGGTNPGSSPAGAGSTTTSAAGGY
jgi:hypothetical protein